jgi:hypothetical protein
LCVFCETACLAFQVSELQFATRHLKPAFLIYVEHRTLIQRELKRKTKNILEKLASPASAKAVTSSVLKYKLYSL